jgi:beta-phosphoglucomutase
MKIKTLLLDLDGVLVDSCEWHYLALNVALEKLGFPAINREDHVAKYNGLPTKQKLYIMIKEDIITIGDIEPVSTLKQEYALELIELHDFSGDPKLELLKDLAAEGIKIGCVTNCIRKTSKRILERAGFLQYIDVLISNEDIDRPKPDPQPYIRAMEELGGLPSSTVIIEDSPVGIESAEGSGACVIEVKNPNDTTIVLRKLLNEQRS